MKRRLYLVILLAAVAFSGLAQNVGDVFYIYRNDGTVNGFITSEVQSMEYSHEDAYGNSYDEIVTQIVTTADSIYKIPLAQIDSVSFVTPKTEYQPDAINISDNLMRYVVSSDSLTFTLSSSTPASLVPKVGDKLVTVEMNDKFPAGFAGKVVEISGTQVTCEAVNLEEVLKQFYYVASTYGVSDDNNAAPSRAPNRIDGIDFYNDRTFTIRRPVLQGGSELSVEPIKDLVSYKVGNKWTITEKPSCRVIVTLIVNEQQGVYINACVSCESVIEETFSVYGGIEIKKDLWSTKDNIIAAVAPFTKFYWKPGLFIRAQAVSAITAIATQKYVLAGAFDASTKKTNIVKPSLTGRMVSADFDLEGSVDGSIDLGAYVELGLTFLSSDFDKFCVTGEVGKEYVAHRVLWNSDVLTAGKETKVYESFKDSKMKSDIYLRASLDLSAGLITASMPTPIDLKFGRKEWDFVPTFSDLTFKRMGNSYGNAKAKVTGKCAFPLEIGLAILDEDGDKVTSHFPYATYHKDPMDMEFTFPNLSSSEKYKFYPIVKWLKTELLASPYAEIGMPPLSVEALDACNITVTSATLVGQLSDYGKDYPGNVFFYYGKTNNPQKTGSLAIVGKVSDMNDKLFSATINDLQENTTYYFVAAYNDGTNTYYSQVRSFRTPAFSLVGNATNITDNSAIITGIIPNYNPDYSYMMLLSKNKENVETDTDCNYEYFYPSADGSFSVELSHLSSNTTYYYALRCNTGNGFIDGDIYSFKTDFYFSAYVLPFDIGSHEVLLFGYGELIGTVEYAFYISKEKDVHSGLKVPATPTSYDPHTFEAHITGLDDMQMYYYALAVIQDGEIRISDVRSFITPYDYIQRELCPDGNHPHLIDLGLPSGTKWSCCNVGSNSPYENGGLYAWGETSEKESSLYTPDGYAYFNWNDGYQYLGDCISGTSYDVATVQWGNDWMMPTSEQVYELREKCKMESFKLIVYNMEGNDYNETVTDSYGNEKKENLSKSFYYGYLMTGPNGNKIFLKKDGHRNWLNPHNPYSEFHYMTGTVDQQSHISLEEGWYPRQSYGCSEYVLSDDSHSSLLRFIGLPVRPVTR